MPIYEYECTSCHHHFDLMQKINEEPAKQCPKCFNNSVNRLVSAAGFQLKGTGWYATDFKTKENTSAKDPASKKEDSAKPAESTVKESTAGSDSTKAPKGETQ